MPEDPTWRPCERGELAKMAGRARSRRLRSAVGRALTISLIGLAVAGGWWLNRPAIEDRLTCGPFQTLLDDYLAGKLERELDQRMAAHMARCPTCRRLWEAARQQRRAGVDGPDDAPIALGQRLFSITAAWRRARLE